MNTKELEIGQTWMDEEENTYEVVEKYTNDKGDVVGVKSELKFN